jgi:hypothetical protein
LNAISPQDIPLTWLNQIPDKNLESERPRRKSDLEASGRGAVGSASVLDTPDESGDEGREDRRQARSKSIPPERRLSFYEHVDGSLDLESDSIGGSARR